MDWQRLKTAVAAVIKQNGNQDITGKVLQDTLLSTINNIGAGRTFAGFATSETNPGTPDGNVIWFATEEGVYSNFSALNLMGRNLFMLYNTASGWEYTAIDIGATLDLQINGSAIAHYSTASQIDLSKAADGHYLTDTGSNGNPRGITIIAGGRIVNDIDVQDNAVYVTTDNGHFWFAPRGSAKWSDLGALGGVPGKDGANGEDGKNAEYYTLVPIQELLAVNNSGVISGTLNYNIMHVVGDSRTPVALSATTYWRHKTPKSSTWNNVKQAGGVAVTWETSADPSQYLTVELIVNGSTVDTRTVNVLVNIDDYDTTITGAKSLALYVEGVIKDTQELQTSQIELRKDFASMSTRQGETEAKVATSVQYDPATGKITSNVNISADQIDIQGAITANGEFGIDKFGNVITGTALSPSAGALTYIVEDKSNLVFEDNITVQLPCDPEYIGRRLLILSQPRHNSAGTVLKPGTNTPITDIAQTGIITIKAARVLNNWVYGYVNGYYIYADGTDLTDPDAVKRAFTGLQYFGGNVIVKQDTSFVLPSVLTVQCGYIELLGIPYTVNNMYATKSPVKNGKKYTVHMTRSDDGLIDDSDTVNGIVDVTPTTEANSPTFGQPNSPWHEVLQLCQWVVINVNAENFTKTY